MSFLLYPKPHDTWHALERPVSGQIQGIPTMRGLAVATNYIHVAIEQPQGVVFGHLEWFVKDKNEPSDLDEAIACRRKAAAVTLNTKKTILFAEFAL